MKTFIFLAIVIISMIFFWRITLLAVACLAIGQYVSKELGGLIFIVGAILLFVRWFGKREGHI
jgi:predicted membrane protein